jgi:hypothetical protein
MYKTFREIIKLWPSYQTLADDVGASYVTAKQWHVRDRIPSRAWQSLVDAAKQRKYAGVTLETLANLDAEYSRKAHAA